MQFSSIPAKFPIPWGNGASAPYIRSIPTASQIGSNPGFASLTDGFPPTCFSPIASGGVPPYGADFNGILKQMTQWIQWGNAGAPVTFDSAFSTSIAGYPMGAILAATAGPNSDNWLSLIDNNTDNPDPGTSGNWTTLGRAVTGDWKWRPTSENLPGWVKANATTIGSASSGASQLASAAAQALYIWHWTNFSNSQCPVTGGRGASALADFQANKPIQVLDMRGVGIMGMDTMAGAASTRLSSVPVTSGNATTAGSLLGENLHTLIIGEITAHNHGVTDPTHFHLLIPGAFQGVQSASSFAALANISQSDTQSALTGVSIQNTGGGGSHNNTQLSLTGTHYLKL